MLKPITSVKLVRGATTIRQGHYFTLGLQPRDEYGAIVNLNGKDIAVTIKDKRGIVFETTGRYNGIDETIEFDVRENIGHGRMLMELTVTDPNDPTLRMKFPTNAKDGELEFIQSTDDLAFAGVRAITVEQLRTEQTAAQESFEAEIVPKVDSIEMQQAQLAADYEAAAGALTEDSEVILARRGEPTLGAFNDKVTAQLADIVGVSIDEYKADRVAIASGWDYTPSLNKAFLKSPRVFLPEGDYYITSEIALPNNATVIGTGMNTRIITTNLTDAIFRAVEKENIFINRVAFHGLDGSYAIKVDSCKHVEVLQCFAKVCALFQSNTSVAVNRDSASPNTDAGLTSTDQGSIDIKVIRNFCYGSLQADGVTPTVAPLFGGIAFRYSKDVVCENNYVEKYRHGIYWWGGDSLPSKDGAWNNPRLAENVRILNNTIYHMSWGGIWGSMGKNVNVIGNHVERCGDVGIDFEGTHGGKASDNFVKNITHGCLSTFFYSENIDFANNTCLQDGTMGKTFYFHSNGATNPDARNISVKDNRFIYTATDGTLGVVNASNMKQFSFEDNELINVRVDFNVQNNGERDVKRNKLLFTIVSAIAFNAMNLGGNHPDTGKPGLTVDGNKIKTLVAQPVGSIGLLVDQFNFNAVVSSHLLNNTVVGFATSIETRDTSQNNGYHMEFLIERNKVDGNIVQGGRVGKGSHLLIENTDLSGQPVPNAVPTTGRWVKGQKLYNANPTANGYIGWINPVTGQLSQTAWQSNAAYSVGQVVHTGENKVYVCTTAGTSAATQPTSISSSVTDGTVVWRYVGVKISFYGFGQIAANPV